MLQDNYFTFDYIDFKAPWRKFGGVGGMSPRRMAVSVIAGLQAGGRGSQRSTGLHEAGKIVDTLCDEQILQLVRQFVRRTAIMGMMKPYGLDLQSRRDAYMALTPTQVNGASTANIADMLMLVPAQQALQRQALQRQQQALLQLAQLRIAQQRERRSGLPRFQPSTPQAPQAPQGPQAPQAPQAPPAAPTASSHQQLRRDHARVARHRAGPEAEKLRKQTRLNSDISQLKTAPSRVCSCGITAKQWATEETRTIGDWENHKKRCRTKRKAEAKAAMGKDERPKKRKRPLRSSQGNAAP